LRLFEKKSVLIVSTLIGNIMKNIVLGLAIVMVASIYGSMTSCERQNDNIPGDPVPIDLTLKQKEVVDAANEFAFDLFIPIVTEQKGAENIMISPFSITSALSMTLNGAAGETFEAMRSALRYDGKTIKEINETYQTLIKDMVPVDPLVTMEIANSAWIEKKFTAKQAFIDALVKWYLAEVKGIDVADPGAVDKVNAWIEDKTHDKIKDMLSSLPDNLAMLLVNAVYFKGKWRHQFDKDDTEERPFYVTPDTPVQVPMMYQKESFAVTRAENATLIELPYGQGNYTMVVMLPNEGISLQEAALTLTPENWAEWMGRLPNATTEVEIYMPRFKYEYKRNLNADLIRLGMGVAFDPYDADFSNISDELQLYITDVLHQTFIETNEEGTEAAAATVVIVGATSMPMPPPVININRPFLYFIRETTTGTIVFMGQVADPS
jgi:serine protease inhibitor